MIGLNCGGSPNVSTTGKCPTYPIASQYNRCGEFFGFACKNGECCSAQGICGTSVKECDAGCQRSWGTCWGPGSFPCFKNTDAASTTRACPLYQNSTDGKCGPEHGFTKCPPSICCSARGYCQDDGGNNGTAWCGEGCLRGFGKCHGFGSYVCATTSTSYKLYAPILLVLLQFL